MLYDITGHALLSPKAESLDADSLNVHATVAEHVLGLRGTTYAGDDAALAAGYVALQVSAQVEADVESAVYSAYSQNGRSFTFRDSPIPIHPLALAGVQALGGGAAAPTSQAADYATLRSVRYPVNGTGYGGGY